MRHEKAENRQRANEFRLEFQELLASLTGSELVPAARLLLRIWLAWKLAGEPQEEAIMKTLFQVSNHHVAESGTPPSIDGDDEDFYVGYFVNKAGEQSVYRFERASGRATLLMGDADWSRELEVVNGEVRGLLLNEAEALWLKACWLSCLPGD